MGRGTGVLIDDATPLNGATVDVGARIGWVLRMARTQAEQAPALDRLATRLGTNITRLHRAETGVLRAGRLADGYETELGLAPGTLRAPIDVLCRTFPYSPVDRDPGEPVTTVREMSRLTDAVGAEGATGGDWLGWARALAQPGAIALPERIAAELVARLVVELSRSTSHGYPTRYEALSLLRCSAYGDVVLDVARDEVAHPHVQVMYDLMSAVGEQPSPEAARWCLELLDSDRPRHVVGASLALEAMGECCGQELWEALATVLIDRLDRAAPGTVAHEWLSHLVRLVPKQVLVDLGRVPTQPLADAAQIKDWSRSRTNRHWTECHERSLVITRELGIPDQPLLTRMLFEVAMGPHESRAVTSYMLLGALPGLPELLGTQLADVHERHPDAVVRERAGRRLAGALHGHDHPVIERWIEQGGERRDTAMYLAGSAGRALPVEVICADPDHAAVYAAGMTGHPVLTELAADAARPEQVRGAARWWLDRGSRVTR